MKTIYPLGVTNLYVECPYQVSCVSAIIHQIETV